MRLAVVLLAAAACADPGLAPGQVGLARAFGEVRGAPPLDLLPPVLDRAGNVYVLYAPADSPEVRVHVGLPDGGWKSGCVLSEGGAGVRAWVGQGEDRAWYWAGDALVEVWGKTGSCHAVLDRDPTTGTDLAFLAVLPRVDESPSRTTVTALITSAGEAQPYLAVIDLDTGSYARVGPLGVPAAAGAAVVGVGAGRDEGVVVFAAVGGATAVWLDGDGAVARTQRLSSWTLSPAVAPLAVADDGTAAGVLDDGRLVAFGAWGDVAGEVPGLTLAGVHPVRGALYAVGTAGGRPAAALLEGGVASEPVPWQISEHLASAMRGRLEVLDDRAETRTWLDWGEARPAISDWPLVSAHAPHLDESGHSGWLVAGPAYRVSGEPYTVVAYVPVGIGYP